jgi:hypothetical protein
MSKFQMTFNTQNVNIAVALRALDSYRNKNYVEAVGALLEVLDLEPRNWDARLMLGACYYKLGQNFAAQNAFRKICEQAKDPEVCARAREGLRATGGRLETETPPKSQGWFGNLGLPSEFSGTHKYAIPWLD